MSRKLTQRTVYLATAVIVASMVGGFALAQLSTGGVNTSYQGSQTTTVTPVQGISYVSTDLVELTSTISSTTCSLSTPCSVTSAGAVDCAGGFTGSTGCAATDYAEEVNLTTVANTAFVGTVTLTVYVTGTPVGGALQTFAGVPFHYTQTSGTNSAQSIIIYFDIGAVATGPGVVDTVSVIGTD
jgi:hypothetical protein